MLLFLKECRLVSVAIKESIKKLGKCKDLRLFIRNKSKGKSIHFENTMAMHSLYRCQ